MARDTRKLTCSSGMPIEGKLIDFDKLTLDERWTIRIAAEYKHLENVAFCMGKELITPEREKDMAEYEALKTRLMAEL